MDNTASPKTLLPQMNLLDFLWLEVTDKCNLQCVHCYCSSLPENDTANILCDDKYIDIIEESYALGCKAITFIGGEPTLHPNLKRFVEHARNVGIPNIEVFTNATYLPDSLLRCFSELNVSVAFSFYCDDPDIHDVITGRPGSHSRAVANIKRMVSSGLRMRVGLTKMDETAPRISQTSVFLNSLGVNSIRIDKVRNVGRAASRATGKCAAAVDDLVIADVKESLEELCGQCWKARLCVSATGAVFPCPMARELEIGSVVASKLSDICSSSSLYDARLIIKERVWEPLRGSSEYAYEGDFACPICQPENCYPNCVPSLPDPICGPQRRVSTDGAL